MKIRAQDRIGIAKTSRISLFLAFIFSITRKKISVNLEICYFKKSGNFQVDKNRLINCTSY